MEIAQTIDDALFEWYSSEVFLSLSGNRRKTQTGGLNI